MKVILTRPCKIKGDWIQPGEIVDLPKAEALRLGKKGACVLPSEKSKDEEEGK